MEFTPHNGHRTWTMAFVLVLGLACSRVSPPSPPPPPPTPSLPEVPGHDDYAHQRFRSPLTVADAQQILLRTRTFAYGGMPPKRQIQAFNLLLDQPDAAARFSLIAAGGHTAGKLYALCAFLALDSSKSRELDDLAGSGVTVLVQDSDVYLGKKTAADVVALLRARHLWDQFRDAKRETEAYFANDR